MEKLYFYYDHTYGEGGVIGHFGELMDFIKNSYDKDRHSIHDCWESHKQCCEDNDNQEEGFDFIDDWEKMVDYFQMSKEEFLKFYSYLSEKDYEATDDRVVRQGLRLEDVTNVGVNCKAIKKGESDA